KPTSTSCTTSPRWIGPPGPVRRWGNGRRRGGRSSASPATRGASTFGWRAALRPCTRSTSSRGTAGRRGWDGGSLNSATGPARGRGGGVAGLTTALGGLAAVRGAVECGLWGANARGGCRRLEVWVLTGLGPGGCWSGAAAAAWRRGRGYLGVALLLWLAALAG